MSPIFLLCVCASWKTWKRLFVALNKKLYAIFEIFNNFTPHSDDGIQRDSIGWTWFSILCLCLSHTFTKPNSKQLNFKIRRKKHHQIIAHWHSTFDFFFLWSYYDCYWIYSNICMYLPSNWPLISLYWILVFFVFFGYTISIPEYCIVFLKTDFSIKKLSVFGAWMDFVYIVKKKTNWI